MIFILIKELLSAVHTQNHTCNTASFSAQTDLQWIYILMTNVIVIFYLSETQRSDVACVIRKLTRAAGHLFQRDRPLTKQKTK